MPLILHTKFKFQGHQPFGPEIFKAFYNIYIYVCVDAICHATHALLTTSCSQTQCFTTLSTLLKLYWEVKRVIMKGSVQWSAVESWAEFRLKQDANSGHRDPKAPRTFPLTFSLQTNTDTFANSTDPDETASHHYEPSHQYLHCLSFCHKWVCPNFAMEESNSETQGRKG